jgi:hypothetical protein
VTAVRLHFRSVNQLARFQTLEAPAGRRFRFTIPGQDLSPRWDLMYYFEVLRGRDGGWLEPDPDARTPYYVVETRAAPAR